MEGRLGSTQAASGKPEKAVVSRKPTNTGLIAEALMAVHTSYLSCAKAGKAPKFAPVRESSGKSPIRTLRGKKHASNTQRGLAFF